MACPIIKSDVKPIEFVVWRLVRDSFSLRESLPRSSMEISGIFDQQVVGFELGCPSNIIQKDALNTLAT